MIRYFTRHKLMAITLASTLTLTTTNFACSTAWMTTIGEYLPLAVQVAESVASLISIFAPGSAATDQQAVSQISAEATQDFQLLQNLYQQYKANPSPDTQAKIENILQTITTNLPKLLEAAHIKNPDLLQKVTASVNILMSIADTIIASFPAKSPQLQSRKAIRAPKTTPQAVRAAWATQVCTGNTSCIALIH